jgi:hypothetical protein
MYDFLYEFRDWKTDKEETFGDRTVKIDFCKSRIVCEDVSSVRNYSWTLHTFNNDDNEWQAGQVSQSFNNITLDVI